MSEKIDLAKIHKVEYSARKKPFLLDVEPALYLAIDGQGEPGGDVFQSRIGTLYAAAYTLKFQSKAAGRDYAVCKLEALWWVDADDATDMSQKPRDEWRWRLCIRVPDFISEEDLKATQTKIRAKGQVTDIDDVTLLRFGEGPCVQMLHVGPYDEEARTVEAIVNFLEPQGLAVRGRHHEIYLSDPRRVDPSRLRTLIRLPVGSA